MNKHKELDKEMTSIRSMTEETCLISASAGTTRPTEMLINMIPDTFIKESILRNTQTKQMGVYPAANLQL